MSEKVRTQLNKLINLFRPLLDAQELLDEMVRAEQAVTEKTEYKARLDVQIKEMINDLARTQDKLEQEETRIKQEVEHAEHEAQKIIEAAKAKAAKVQAKYDRVEEDLINKECDLKLRVTIKEDELINLENRVMAAQAQLSDVQSKIQRLREGLPLEV